jgi:uncharacterized protein (TIGR02246 family)
MLFLRQDNMNDQISGILAILDEFAASYRDRDAARYLTSFAEPAFVYGTGADEKCRGLSEIRAHVERDWAQSTSASFTLSDPTVAVAGKAAWVAADCHFDFRTAAGDCAAAGRATFVLEEFDGGWRLRHAHFSLPALTAEGESF